MLNEAENKERMAVYEKGLTDAESAELLFISSATFYHWRKKNNLPAHRDHRHFISKAEEEKRLELYNKGFNDHEIANKCLCTPPNISAWRNRRGLKSNYKKAIKERRSGNGTTSI